VDIAARLKRADFVAKIGIRRAAADAISLEPLERAAETLYCTGARYAAHKPTAGLATPRVAIDPQVYRESALTNFRIHTKVTGWKAAACLESESVGQFAGVPVSC